jgi:CRISPR-associated protein Cmr3
MATYLIKLYPIDRFFFGSDVTFGEDNENKNYFVRSVYFPQQTTLLGMLRYYLLKQNDLLSDSGRVINQHSADQLIGAEGFNAKNPGSFGIIKSLSPAFITGPDGEYFVQSREYGLNWKEDEITGDKQRELTSFKLRELRGRNTFSSAIYYLEGLNSKTEIPDLLVNSRSGRIRFFDFQRERIHDPMNGIFVPNEQIGIRKPCKQGNPGDGKAKDEDEDEGNEKGFYKQVGYSMKPGYGFACYAEMDISGHKIDNGLVKMGADQSWFRIECELQKFSVGNAMEHLTNHLYHGVNDRSAKIVLLSDTCLDRDPYNKYVLASAATVAFRYLETNSQSKSPVFSFSRAGLTLRKTEQFRTLLKRGSVLYLSDGTKKQDLLKEILENKAFYQIGYNHAI